MIPEQILHLLEPMLRSYLQAERGDAKFLVSRVPEGLLILAHDGSHIIVRADKVSLLIDKPLPDSFND